MSGNADDTWGFNEKLILTTSFRGSFSWILDREYMGAYQEEKFP